MAYLSFFHGDLLAGLFSWEQDVIAAAWDYLRAYAIDCLLTCFLFCFVGYFNGRGTDDVCDGAGIVGAFGVRIPVSYFMSRLPETSLFYIGLATPPRPVIQIILCVAYFLLQSRKDSVACLEAGEGRG